MLFGRFPAKFMLVSLIAVKSSNAVADTSDWDLVAKLGGAIGQLTTQGDTTAASSQAYILGGVALALGLSRDLSPAVTSVVQGGMLLDSVNRSIVRQALEVGIAYHLLGGSRQSVLRLPGSEVVARNPYNLSFVLRGGLANFASADPKNPDVGFAGSLVESKLGIEYRYDWSDESAFGVEFISTLFSLPSSRERLQYKAVELLGFYRWAL
jgi:hypothetical protein